MLTNQAQGLFFHYAGLTRHALTGADDPGHVSHFSLAPAQLADSAPCNQASSRLLLLCSATPSHTMLYCAMLGLQGNVARCFNHSCDANCMMQAVFTMGARWGPGQQLWRFSLIMAL
jgi:hypothetical protein